MNIVIYGNSGSGKTTLARHMASVSGAAVLSLDAIAWKGGVERASHEASVRAMREFMAAHEAWIMEGCYGTLVEAALPHVEMLIFLNPGVAACVSNCRARPWEPDKFASPDEQGRMIESLIEWVKQYETRNDEFGLHCHRRIFEAFPGRKIERTEMNAELEL